MESDKGSVEKENVISMFSAKNASAPVVSGDESRSTTISESSFEDELKKNKELADKLKRERQKANQAVLRSYRLKT